MAEHTSERRRWRHPREGDDLPREVREAEGGVEVQEREAGVREVSETRGSVEHRLGAALRELEAREGREETISRRLREAFDDLERREQRKESTEARLREALESLEDDDDSIQLTLEAAVQLGGTEAARSKNDTPEGSDTDLRRRTEDAEKSSQEIPKEVSGHNPEAPASLQRGDLRVPHVKFESMEEVDKAILQHTHVENNLSSENYEKCRQYIRVISEKDDVSSKEIAERENLDERVVDKWREGGGPSPIHVIENMEFQRLEHEQAIPEEALKHRIDPAQAHEVTGRLRESEQHSIKELVDVVEGLHNRIERVCLGSVHYAELYDSQKSLVEDRLRDLAPEIRVNRDVIQSELNVRFGLDGSSDHEVRIGVTDSRLYYWHINTSPDLWVNVLADQKFYMSKEDKMQLIDELRAHLHIRGGGQTAEHYLNDLLNQLSGLESHAANRIQRYGVNQYFDGEILHLIGDTLERPNEFRRVTTHLGISSRGRVSNLKWPDISEFRIKTYAIIESDGTLFPNGQLRYSQKNDARRKLAVDEFQEFGDFELKEYRGPSGKEAVVRVELPMVYGTMMKYWGVSEGDKASQNRGFSDVIVETPLQNKVQYLSEVGADDGSFSDRRFYIGRSHAVESGPFYDELVQFIKDHGTGLKASLHYQTGERIQLRISKIRELTTDESIDTQSNAKRIEELVDEQPNRLLNDEVEHILKPLGIHVTTKPQRLVYSYRTGRVSVDCRTQTSSINDSIRWALIGPPNHPRKMKAVNDFLKARQKGTDEVSLQIREDGFEIHPLWHDFKE